MGNFRLNRENFVGPWAGLPVAWTEDERFDEATYRGDVERLCDAGVPGIYTAGTTGEFYAMEFDEWQAITKATIEECKARTMPVMIGCSSTYTLGAARRAAFAAEQGADAIQVALPFWMEVGCAQVVPFFKEVAAAAEGLALSIYETMRAKKALTIGQHRAVKEAVPSYLMVKANAGTIGHTPEGCRALAEFTNVFVGEESWVELGPLGAAGCCSSIVYWSPTVILGLWKELQAKNWPAVEKTCRKLKAVLGFYGEAFAGKGFLDSAGDRLGAATNGVLKAPLRCRGPYPSATDEDVETLCRGYREHFPEMLES